MARISKSNKNNHEITEGKPPKKKGRPISKTEELVLKITIGIVFLGLLGLGIFYMIQHFNKPEHENPYEDFLIVNHYQVTNLVKASRNDGSATYDDLKDGSVSGTKLYDLVMEHSELDFFVLYIETAYSNTHVGKISRELESTIMQLPREGFSSNAKALFLIVDLSLSPDVLVNDTLDLINHKGMGDIQSPIHGGPYLLYSTNRSQVGSIDEAGDPVELNINGISQSARTIDSGKFSTQSFIQFLFDNILN